MCANASNFLTAHYPNTFMERFCKTLHPDLDFGTVCVSWFRQATAHCTNLITNDRLPTTYFWNSLKNFIFPDRTTALMSQKIPISIHPKQLSIHDCQSLLLDIVNDYVQRAPRYAAESTTNVMLWQVLYALMGIMALGSLLMCIVLAYKKYGQTQKIFNPLENLLKPEKCMQRVAKRSLCLAKTELRNIRIKPIAKPEHILPTDGAAVMAVKVSTKYEILEQVVAGCLNSTGKLHSLYDKYNKTKSDGKIESLNKAMKFLDNDCKKLHLLLMFEENPVFEESNIVKKGLNSPRIKNVSPTRTTEPKSTIANNKRMVTCRIVGGGSVGATTPRSFTPKASSMSPGSQSVKQITPRSAAFNSGIPRNTTKRSSQSRASK